MSCLITRPCTVQRAPLQCNSCHPWCLLVMLGEHAAQSWATCVWGDLRLCDPRLGDLEWSWRLRLGDLEWSMPVPLRPQRLPPLSSNTPAVPGGTVACVFVLAARRGDNVKTIPLRTGATVLRCTGGGLSSIPLLNWHNASTAECFCHGLINRQ